MIICECLVYIVKILYMRFSSVCMKFSNGPVSKTDLEIKVKYFFLLKTNGFQMADIVYTLIYFTALNHNALRCTALHFNAMQCTTMHTFLLYSVLL